MCCALRPSDRHRLLCAPPDDAADDEDGDGDDEEDEKQPCCDKIYIYGVFNEGWSPINEIKVKR